MSNVNMLIERPYATSCIGNCNVCSIYHRLRDNDAWTSQCARFESLTLKTKRNSIDDFAGNWHTNLFWWIAYACKCLETLNILRKSTMCCIPKKNKSGRFSQNYGVHIEFLNMDEQSDNDEVSVWEYIVRRLFGFRWWRLTDHHLAFSKWVDGIWLMTYCITLIFKFDKNVYDIQNRYMTY